MKWLSQTVVPLVVVVGLVFLIAFISQYKPSEPGVAPGPKLTKQTTGQQASIEHLKFPETTVLTPMDIELGTQGHFEFWFQNPNSVPVEVGIQEKSCTCTNVDIG